MVISQKLKSSKFEIICEKILKGKSSKYFDDLHFLTIYIWVFLTISSFDDFHFLTICTRPYSFLSHMVHNGLEKDLEQSPGRPVLALNQGY